MRIGDEVLVQLSALEYPTADRVRIAGVLDRGAYQRLDKVLRALGGAWDRRAKAHVFPGDAREAVDAAIVSGEVTTHQDLCHFPTPVGLAKELVELADVRAGNLVLEPSAGTGRIVHALRAAGAHDVVAIERDALRRDALLGDCRLVVPEHDDFLVYPRLRCEVAMRFDRVVMNPPFRRVGLGDHVDHVRHAFGLLAAHGVLVAVLPSSVTFRQDRRHAEFRDWIARGGGVVEALPDGSFRESGTDVRAVTLRMVAP
jgi:predicted RNA methylase